MSVEAKICGLTRGADARAAAEAGADYIGVVFAAGPRARGVGQAAEIWDGVEARRAGVFVDAEIDAVLEVANGLDLRVVQLHGAEDAATCRRIREAGPWVVWKALRVIDAARLEDEVKRYAGVVDGILLEGHSPLGSGGVGARFDWSRLDAARASWPADLKLIMAGGLTPDSVGAAIAAVRPDVVDVSSGVESEVGRKDHAAVRAFLDAVRRAASR